VKVAPANWAWWVKVAPANQAMPVKVAPPKVIFPTIESLDVNRFRAFPPEELARVASTMEDLNRFFRLLLRGELLDATLLAEMQKTVPIRSFSGAVIDVVTMARLLLRL
jgi:hypothetical protein